MQKQILFAGATALLMSVSSNGWAACEDKWDLYQRAHAANETLQNKIKTLEGRIKDSQRVVATNSLLETTSSRTTQAAQRRIEADRKELGPLNSEAKAAALREKQAVSAYSSCMSNAGLQSKPQAPDKAEKTVDLLHRMEEEARRADMEDESKPQAPDKAETNVDLLHRMEDEIRQGDMEDFQREQARRQGAQALDGSQRQTPASTTPPRVLPPQQVGPDAPPASPTPPNAPSSTPSSTTTTLAPLPPFNLTPFIGVIGPVTGAPLPPSEAGPQRRPRDVFVGPSAVDCRTVNQGIENANKDLTTYSAAIKRANQNISEIDDRMASLSYPPVGMGNRETIIAN